MVEIQSVPPLSEPCTGRDAARQDGLPWVRLVLSLLLLGAPALALALDAAQQSPHLAGSLDQPAPGGWQKEGWQKAGCQKNGWQKSSSPSSLAALFAPHSKTSGQMAAVATPWRIALRHMAASARTLAHVHHWVQPAPFSHGRVVDPARYLQRTLR